MDAATAQRIRRDGQASTLHAGPNGFAFDMGLTEGRREEVKQIIAGELFLSHPIPWHRTPRKSRVEELGCMFCSAQQSYIKPRF
jgi:hypothetical protein